MDWVTDQNVIDVLVALKALRPGDEVKIVGGAKYRLPDLEDGCVLVLRDDPDGYVGKTDVVDNVEWSGDVCVARFHHPDRGCNSGTWVICRKNIAAWRRPGVPKEQ